MDVKDNLTVKDQVTEMTARPIKVEFVPRGLTMDVDRQAFALALKTYRYRNNLTQRALAERWDCSRWTILRAESGKAISWQVAYRMFARLAEDLRKEGER